MEIAKRLTDRVEIQRVIQQHILLPDSAISFSLTPPYPSLWLLPHPSLWLCQTGRAATPSPLSRALSLSLSPSLARARALSLSLSLHPPRTLTRLTGTPMVCLSFSHLLLSHTRTSELHRRTQAHTQPHNHTTTHPHTHTTMHSLMHACTARDLRRHMRWSEMPVWTWRNARTPPTIVVCFSMPPWPRTRRPVKWREV